MVDIIREDVMPLIEQYVRERGEYLKAKGFPKAKALFPNINGGKDDFYSDNRFRMIKQKVVKASGVDFKLKDFRSTLTTMTVSGDQSRLNGMSNQSRHESPSTTQKFYNRVELSKAGKRLKDVWKENPVIAQKDPVIENRFEMTGYS